MQIIVKTFDLWYNVKRRIVCGRLAFAFCDAFCRRKSKIGRFLPIIACAGSVLSDYAAGVCFMVTRRQSVDNFCVKIDNLIDCAYLLSASRVTAVLKALTSSRLFFELITFCSDGVDFDHLLQDYSLVHDPYPTDDKKTLIAFGFRLLAAVDAGEIELLDVMNNNYKRNNLERSYQNFCNLFLKPFKHAVTEAAEKMISASDAERMDEKAEEYNNDYVANHARNEETSAEADGPVFARAVEEGDTPGRKNYLTCYSDIQAIVSEERAKIMSTRMHDREKRDLLMLLDAFRGTLFKGTKAQIGQAFVSYKYAVQNFKRVDSGVDDIGRILRFCGIIG